MTDAEVVEQIARQHLSPDVADRWLALCRPAIRLEELNGETVGETPAIATFGGLPRLPDDVEWPTWPGQGPLTYLGEIDLDAVARSGLDPGVRLPTTGRLLAFYFDGSVELFRDANTGEHVKTVGYFEPGSTRAGARLLHLPADDCAVRTAPLPDWGYPERRFFGRQILSTPDLEQPVLFDTFAEGEDLTAFYQTHPVNADAFREALRERNQAPWHQLGGWAMPVQGPVEFEAVWAEGIEPGDPRTNDLARAWRPVLQIDSDEDFLWGDVGTLYWMQRERGEGGLDIEFTWQCC
ncbi:DUF1963 domain-containing protein [Flexivirga caeni]|nr:DUF1963 domain-containing protein [Flexivirga caeni]